MQAYDYDPPICTNCPNKATINEAGVHLCQDCAEDHPHWLLPIIDARRLEAREQEWKDLRNGT